MGQVICGDTFDVLPTLQPGSIDLVVTSPPYAEKRKKHYGGIPEKDYPAWTVAWMELVKPLLKPAGSVAIVIRSHVQKGFVSDYVLKTRLALHHAGWGEPEELLWIKPDAPPWGSIKRPRRSWEHILWFSQNCRPYNNPQANGQESNRLGWGGGFKLMTQGILNTPRKIQSGTSRCRDYIAVGTNTNDRSKDNKHPAIYPVALAEWIIRLLSPPDGTILDPFGGSGSSAVAAIKQGRQYILVEKSPEYCKIAERRIVEETYGVLDKILVETNRIVND